MSQDRPIRYFRGHYSTPAEAEDVDPVEIVIAETEPLQQRLPIELGKALAATPVPEGAHKAFGESIKIREAMAPRADDRRHDVRPGGDFRVPMFAVQLRQAARSLRSAETHEEAVTAAAPMGALAEKLPVVAAKLLNAVQEESQAVTQQLDTWIENLRRTLAQREAEREEFTRQVSEAIRIGEEIVRRANAAATATGEAVRQVEQF